MPVTSKIVTVTTSASADKALVRVLNRTTGDIWDGIVSTDTLILDLANNNIWGDEPTQWVNGDVLEIYVFHNNIGATTHTLINGLNEPTVTMASPTAVQLVL
jgi:hypothetical protein